MLAERLGAYLAETRFSDLPSGVIKTAKERLLDLFSAGVAGYRLGLYRPVLAALNAGAIISSLIGVVLALAIPVTLLGCVSPFAIRLGVRDVSEAGRVSGRMYAISTWGSLLGTYLPVLVIIPQAGTRVAAILFGLVLLLVGFGGLWQVNRKQSGIALLLAIGLIPFIFFWTQGGVKAYPGQIYETESAYNYIQVVRQEEYQI